MPSTLVTPLLISKPFGFGASNPTYINIPIPVPSQIGTTVNAASFTDGFPPSTMTPEASGGLPFFGQDLNGIMYMVTAYCANFAAGALPTYNSSLSSAVSGYPVGVVLVNTTGNGLWINNVSGNTSNPDTGGAGWSPLATTGKLEVTLAGSNVTLGAELSSYPYIQLVGTLTANVNVIFPANGGQSWILANSCIGSFTVTAKTASGTGITIPATGAAAPTSIYCDATNIQNTGVSTAGLAPIASPALTGTPTTPTASASSNTTQIASTAMVQAAITAALSTYAKLASPIFSGTPTTPTPATSDSSLKIASTAFVQAVAAGTSLLSGNGYQKFASGLILQWGSISIPGTGGASVTFPLSFPSAVFAIVMFGPNGSYAYYASSSVTTSGFNCDNSDGSDTTVNYWIAIGK